MMHGMCIILEVSVITEIRGVGYDTHCIRISMSNTDVASTLFSSSLSYMTNGFRCVEYSSSTPWVLSVGPGPERRNW